MMNTMLGCAMCSPRPHALLCIRSPMPMPRPFSRNRDFVLGAPEATRSRYIDDVHARRFSMSRHDPIDRNRRALLGAGAAWMLGAWPGRAPAQTGGKSKIGVIGSGKIGGTIGGLWVKAGHPVLFSSRHPEELKEMVTGLGSLAQAGSVDQAIAFGDLLFIAVPYGAVPQGGQQHAAAFKGKVMLDACNAVRSEEHT